MIEILAKLLYLPLCFLPLAMAGWFGPQSGACSCCGSATIECAPCTDFAGDAAASFSVVLPSLAYTSGGCDTSDCSDVSGTYVLSEHTGTDPDTSGHDCYVDYGLASGPDECVWSNDSLSLTCFACLVLDVIFLETYPDTIATDGAMTASDATLTAASAPFTSDMVGRTIRVLGAGLFGGNLTTTVSSFTSTSEVELADAASTTVSGADVKMDTITWRIWLTQGDADSGNNHGWSKTVANWDDDCASPSSLAVPPNVSTSGAECDEPTSDATLTAV